VSKSVELALSPAFSLREKRPTVPAKNSTQRAASPSIAHLRASFISSASSASTSPAAREMAQYLAGQAAAASPAIPEDIL
jgi:hypothetical protein